MQTSHPTAVEVLSRLKAAQSMLGGRIALTYNVGDEVECYVTHWHRPEPHAFEACDAVASGTLRECLDQVDRYATQHAPVSRIAAE